MPKVPVYNMQGEAIDEIELSDGIWNIAGNPHAVHDVVQSMLASRRAGTHKVKTRDRKSVV